MVKPAPGQAVRSSSNARAADVSWLPARRQHPHYFRDVTGFDGQPPAGRTAAWDLARWSGGTGTPAGPVPLASAIAASYRLGSGPSAPP